MLFIVPSLFFSLALKAEYRAYQLQIRDLETDETYFVLSTLDHIQYPQYHHLNKNEQITYYDSWMCWENTGNNQTICPNPKVQGPNERAPASPSKD